MADFAHLTDHLLLKSQSAVFYSFHELGHKITISQFGTTVAVKRDVPKNSPKLLSFRNISVSVNFITQVTFFFLLFVGMVMYANEFLKSENQKFTEIKK